MRIFFLFLLLTPQMMLAQVAEYLDDIRANGKTKVTPEHLWKTPDVVELTEQLKAYALDSLTDVADEAFNIVALAGRNTNDAAGRQAAVRFLAGGLNNGSSRIVSNNIGRLRHFGKTDVDTTAQRLIEERLDKWNAIYYEQVAKMAAQLGVGYEQILSRQMIDKESDVETRWAMHLAMARLGEQRDIDFVVRRAASIPYEYVEDLMRLIIPELIYTRQKQAIDVCVKILQDDGCKCASGNPNVDAKILCGYRIMELLAPVVKGFPYAASATGMIETDDYEEALRMVRKWFADNPNYEVIE